MVVDERVHVGFKQDPLDEAIPFTIRSVAVPPAPVNLVPLLLLIGAVVLLVKR